MTMNIEVLNRIILARHLYELGLNASTSSNDKFLFAAVNLLQDSVEAFLLALAEHLKADFNQNTSFEKYFDLINEKIEPKKLPFRSALIRVNKLRINSKHYGIQPDRDEVTRLFVTVREFFEEACNSYIEASFSTVGVVNLLKDGEVKDLLIEAKEYLEASHYSECAINCRKAIYLELESNFDISVCKDGTKPRGLIGHYCRAPFYAQNSKYIDEYVKDPTDFVVLDHGALDQDLLKYSVDSTSFWNVWRLTPEVWRDQEKNWYVKRDFDKLEEPHIKDRIEYIYSTTTDIIFSIHIKKASIKTQDYHSYIVNLVDADVPVYDRADRNTIVGVIPKGVGKVDCDFSVEGFNRDGTYWRVSHTQDKKYISGYIHGDFLVWDKC